MKRKAKALLMITSLIAVLAASGPAYAAPPARLDQPGMNAYVMMVLEMFFGPDIGAMISAMASGETRAAPGMSNPHKTPPEDGGMVIEL
jgi:hypothetical protein